MAISEEPGRRLIRRALSGDHIACDRPGSPTEADEGGLRRESRFDAIDRLKDRRQMDQRKFGKAFYGFGSRQGVQSRAFANFKRDFLSESVGNDKNVAEENGGVETKAANGLKGGLGREAGV